MKETVVRTQIHLEALPQFGPVATKLWEAREWLKDEEHWDSTGRDGSKSCAVVALSHPRHGEMVSFVWMEPAEYLARCLPRPSVNYTDVWLYNDADPTAHSDILALFDRAIDLALAEGK